MKRKTIQTHLVIAISAFILVFPAYLRCSSLAGAKFLSTDLSFENPDPEDVLSDQQNPLGGFVSIVCSTKMLPGTNLFDQISRFCFLASFPDQKTLILRC